MIEDLYRKDCIRTYTGKYVNVFAPTLDMICIEDIAHSLSMQSRFGGHLPIFYPVSAHSLRCTELISDPLKKLEALMHDASEAYLVDIPKPVKNGLSNYKEIEDRMMTLIAIKFGFNYPLSDEIKKVDNVVLEEEWNKRMLAAGKIKGIRLFIFRIVSSYNSYTSERKFLKMFKKYSNTK